MTEAKKDIPKKIKNDEEKKLPAKFKELIEKIEKMSVLDLSEFVKILEDRFGVSAAAPVATVSQASAGEKKPEEEKTTFNVELTDTGTNKIGVIKTIRELIQIGLREAKELADKAPKIVKEGVGKEEAEEAKKKLEAVGAKVTLK